MAREARRGCAHACRGIRMTCPSCGADNRPDAKFCFECGSALARTCPNGHPVAVRRPLLRRVRGGRRGYGSRLPAAPVERADGRAPPRLGPVRRPRRLHAALGAARRRGGARAPLALLRHVPPADRALRRHGREVHRRRGDGGLGHADRDRGRRRARRAGGARPGRRRLGARRRGRRRGASRARRRPHRRGRGHDRRRGRGHGRRRSRQHGVARAVGRRARARSSSASRRAARPSRRSSTRRRARSSSRARRA